jgi:hypothetical protein
LPGFNPPGDNIGLGDTESSGTFLDILGLNLGGENSADLIPFDTSLIDSKPSSQLSPVLAETTGKDLLTPELSLGLFPETLNMTFLPIFGKETGNSFAVGSRSVLIADNISRNFQNNAEPLVIIEAPLLVPEINSEKMPGPVVGTTSSLQSPIDAAAFPETVMNRPEMALNNQNAIIVQPETEPASMLKEVSSSALWGNMAAALNIRQMRISTPEAAPNPVARELGQVSNAASRPQAIIDEGEIIKPAPVSSEPVVVSLNKMENKSAEPVEDGPVPEPKFDLGEESPEVDIVSRLSENPGKASAAGRQSTDSPAVAVEAASRQDAVSSARETTPPMRFVLPENLKNQTSERGRTIMIKMEPENLGSVRMTMSSIHDTITARLVVDSPLARTAVEANLNQLLEQLDRQGIKVDFFDVSVGGSHVGDNAREQAASSGRRFSGRLVSDIEKIWGGNDGSMSSLRLNYIGASGVNCLA